MSDSKQTESQQTLFAGDTHASHSVPLGSEKARMMTAISGRRLLGLYENCNLPMEFSRMLLDTSAWASTRCYLTWKASATPQRRLLFRLVPSTPRTDEIGSGLLPTPAASEANDYNTNWQSLANVDKGGRVMRRIASMMLLPTPCANDNRDRGGPSNPSVQRREKIGKSIELSMHFDGPLNPQFVEGMMGYPVDWTNLGSQGLETPLSPK